MKKDLRSLDLNARQVCRAALQSCTTPYGLVAGTHHFVDLWARDSLFATLGASSDLAQTTIETFFRFQRIDGAVPYRIFYRCGKLWPNFRSVQSGGFVPDGGLMAIIAAKKFGKTYQKHIKKTRDFYTRTYGTNLISEWFQCEWADSVLKIGKTLYTNVLYWKASENEHIRKKINKSFWNGSYFSDWVDYRRHDYFASHPNMLAIVFGLATHDQAEKILAYAKKYCWNGWVLEENYPAYPFWRIPIGNHLIRMGDYHNRGVIWLQPTILYAVALHRAGHITAARDVFASVGKQIVASGDVYEVYEKNGTPVRRWMYRSEGPFAWSAGLYLWARSILNT